MEDITSIQQHINQLHQQQHAQQHPQQQQQQQHKKYNWIGWKEYGLSNDFAKYI